MQLFGLSRICRPQEKPLSAGRVRVHTCCECYNKRGYIRAWYVYKIFFFIFRLMRYSYVCFFSLLDTTTSGKATDMIAGICTFPRLPCPSTKRHVMLNLTSAAAAAAATALRNAGRSCSVFFSFSSNSLEKATWWWMLYRTLRKVPGTTKVRLWERTCDSWLQDVLLLLLSFLLWCSDDRRKNTRTGTPWCIADRLLQVLRSRLITNY